MEIRNWAREHDSPLTEDAIRQLYPSDGSYCIRRKRFPIGVTVSGAGAEATWYVLSGSCRLTCGNLTVVLHAGDYVIVPTGGFDHTTLGPDELVFVKAWRLPPTYAGTPTEAEAPDAKEADA